MTSLKEFLDSKNMRWGYTEDPVPLSFSRFHKWLASGMAGELHYLKDHRANLRQNISLCYPDFRSALVFIFPYTEAVLQLQKIYQDKRWNGLHIASYAFGFDGFDYHHSIKKILDEIAQWITGEKLIGGFKIAVDTLPLLERDLARKAGHGVMGDNSMLIHSECGSYFMIGSILLDTVLDLNVSAVLEGDCGSCGACTKLCPGQAITHDGVDANKCFSAYSIEIFKDVPAALNFQESNWLFGCDRCQDVCPWNRHALKQCQQVPSLSEKQQFLADFWLLRPREQILADLDEMSNSHYTKLFKGTSFERTGRIGLYKNIKALTHKNN